MRTTTTTTVVVVGAGPAGLAMSRCLTRRAIDHVLIERGVVANAWHTERWDSLRLLTPNWMTRLPDWHYGGDDPAGFMRGDEVAAHLDAYRHAVRAPVESHTTVTSVRTTPQGFAVETDRGRWTGACVVVATGAAGVPRIPALARLVPETVTQVSPIGYRNPGRLPGGAVLVVGASASGLQIADELVRAGRAVTIAVGEHVRVPRTYRGMDIHWWMDTIGLLEEPRRGPAAFEGNRRLRSLQLIGSPERRDLDLHRLRRRAGDVRVVGRLVRISGSRAQFDGSLAGTLASADLRMRRLLDRIDDYATRHGLDDEVAPPERARPITVTQAATTADLRDFSALVWATGYRPEYPWLGARHLDGRGQIRHDGGVLEQPGLYALGLPFLRRRRSTFLDGLGGDAEAVAGHLAARLCARARTRTASGPGTPRPPGAAGPA